MASIPETIMTAGAPLVVQRLTPTGGLSLEQREHNAKVAELAGPEIKRAGNKVAVVVGGAIGFGCALKVLFK